MASSRGARVCSYLDRDAVGITFLVCSTVTGLTLVPDLDGALLAHPGFGALVGAAIALSAAITLRGRRPAAARAEKVVFAGFLFLMPSVYVLSWLTAGRASPGLWLELAGQLIFGALAIAGVRRSPWYLVAGIAAHGLFWDALHIGRTSYVPDWYALACLIIDVGWAVYAATQIAAWSGRPPATRESRGA